jgi:hypothetical protein
VPDGIKGMGTAGMVVTDCPAEAGEVEPGAGEAGYPLAATAVPFTRGLWSLSPSKTPKPIKPNSTAPAMKYSTTRSKIFVRLLIQISSQPHAPTRKKRCARLLGLRSGAAETRARTALAPSMPSVIPNCAQLNLALVAICLDVHLRRPTAGRPVHPPQRPMPGSYRPYPEN